MLKKSNDTKHSSASNYAPKNIYAHMHAKNLYSKHSVHNILVIPSCCNYYIHSILHKSIIFPCLHSYQHKQCKHVTNVTITNAEFSSH